MKPTKSMHQKAPQKTHQHKVHFGVLFIEEKPTSYAVPRILLNEMHPKYQLHYIGEFIYSLSLTAVSLIHDKIPFASLQESCHERGNKPYLKEKPPWLNPRCARVDTDVCFSFCRFLEGVL